MIRVSVKHIAVAAALAFLAISLSGCATTPECGMPQGHNLERAFDTVEANLSNGCEAYFDSYFDQLLSIAEGDPSPQHKRRFSDFLLWANDAGLLSRRQAMRYYNRYFNVKFVSMAGEYNNCAYTCPKQQEVLANMEQELNDKQQGLLRIAEDRDSYYRADRLLQETELVLAATCNACSAN